MPHRGLRHFQPSRSKTLLQRAVYSSGGSRRLNLHQLRFFGLYDRAAIHDHALNGFEFLWGQFFCVFVSPELPSPHAQERHVLAF